ncbi:MAG TPA: ATP-binding protein [Candidatus Baltobacteraceae bacterium]|nr:ATP-binding protein [Candidatus Baltobacteraceae bacterium]
MSVAQHAWFFETDTARDALEGRHLLERYLSNHCENCDLFAANLVFGELISNVIKHAPGGGVRVWLEPEGPRFALCIKDDGKGFSKAPSFELPADPGSESGRGLYLVKKLTCNFEYKRDDGFMVRAVLPVTRRS